MKVLDAKYAGRCAECGVKFIVGTRVAWLGKNAVYHPDCAPKGTLSIPETSPLETLTVGLLMAAKSLRNFRRSRPWLRLTPSFCNLEYAVAMMEAMLPKLQPATPKARRPR